MGKFCAAYGCGNSHKDKGKGISLHKFPEDPALKDKWAFVMRRKGFQCSRRRNEHSKYSFVCSVHFKPEDFEPEEKSQEDRKRVRLKKNAIPTIFTTGSTGLPSHLQSGEKKRRTLQRVNPVVIMKQKLPPVCLEDENPCCEREEWENIPIVSPMCLKCALSCGTNEGKKELEEEEGKDLEGKKTQQAEIQ